MTHLRENNAGGTPGSKITALVLGWVEDSVIRSDSRGVEVPDHLPSAKLLRSLADRRAPLFVTDSLVQDQPDQPTLSMGNDPDGLIVSETRDRAAIHNFENASFGSGCSVSSLIK